MGISITIDDTAARSAIARLQQLGFGLSAPMRAVALTLDQLVRNTFRDQTDPFGKKWEPHKPSTTANRARRGQASQQILIDSGALYSSLGHESDGVSATVFAGTDYAEVHQFGNPNNKAWGRGSAPIPPRPFFPTDDLPDTWWTPVLGHFDDAIEEAIA